MSAGITTRSGTYRFPNDAELSQRAGNVTAHQATDGYEILQGKVSKREQVSDTIVRYEFDVVDHMKILMNNMCLLQRSQKLQDITIVTNTSPNKEFEFHGVLLAATSQKFRQILCGSNVEVSTAQLRIKDVDEILLGSLQDYLYNTKGPFKYGGVQNRLDEFVTKVGLDYVGKTGKGDVEKIFKTLGTLFDKNCCTFTSVNGVLCHAAVIAAVSEPIRNALLGVSDLACDVTYDEVDVSMLKILIPYVYHAEIDIKKDYVCELLPASLQLGFMGVTEVCCDFLETSLQPANAIVIMNYTRNVSKTFQEACITQVQEAGRQLIITDLLDVVFHGKFEHFETHEDIIDVISNADMAPFKQNPDNLMALVNQISNWYGVDMVNRVHNYTHIVSVITTEVDIEGLVEVFQRVASIKEVDVSALFPESFRAVLGGSS